MRKVFLCLLSTILAASCADSSRLYYWGGSSSNGTTLYEELVYKQYDQQSPENICALVCLYEDMVTHPGGTRQVPPPGVCAEYGFLLMQPQTAEYFAQYATSRQRKSFNSTDYSAAFSERAEAMLAQEMELYPESAKFIAPLLKRAQERRQS